MLFVLGASGPALADDGPPSQERVVRWYWRDFQVSEYVATGVLGVGSGVLRFAVPWSSEPNVTEGVLLDDWVYEELYPEDDDVWTGWSITADVPFYASFGWLVAEPLAAGIAHDWDVAWQMTMVNLESLSLYSMLFSSAQYFVRRRRPIDRQCDGRPPPGRTDQCDDQRSVRSFIGGHTGMVGMTAALTCLHHAYMPLYGGGVRDGMPCAAWVAATALVFTGRTVTGAHYFTDNALSLGLGTFAGGFMPWALHYAHGPGPTSTRGLEVMPTVSAVEEGDGGVLGLVGRF
jgi:hypothetical protein